MTYLKHFEACDVIVGGDSGKVGGGRLHSFLASEAFSPGRHLLAESSFTKNGFRTGPLWSHEISQSG
jgi:hypothetical protein